METIINGISTVAMTRLLSDRWLSSSLINKAIRRGDLFWAIAAARALFEVEPQRLWRRMVVIAVEDIGMADLVLVGSVVGAYRLRNKGSVTQRWERVVDLIQRLVASTKCRATDDLEMSITTCRDVSNLRQHLADQSLEKLANIAAASRNLEEAAVSARYVLGTNRPGTMGFAARKGAPSLLFDTYLFNGNDVAVVEMARDGFSATGCTLFGFLPILSRQWTGENLKFLSDEIQPSGLIDDVPAFALDFFTRNGRAALGRFLKGKSETARWIADRVPASSRVNLAAEMLFRIDGGACLNRMLWPAGQRLEERARRFAHRYVEDAVDLLRLFKADFPEFDSERCTNG